MEAILVPLMSLAMMVGLCLVLRKPLLWYYKIDKHLVQQQQIIDLLQKITDGKTPQDGFVKQKKKTSENPIRIEKEA